MHLPYAYTPQIWPPMMVVVLMIALSVFCLRRRSAPGALQFMIACLFAAAWSACLLMNHAAVGTATKVFWLKAQGIIQLPIIIAITCFILDYAWPGRWLTRRNLALLYFPILPSVILLLTNDLHHLAWRGFSLMNGALRPQFGLGSWILVVYFFGLMEILNLVVFGWLFRHSPQHRWPVAFMMAGQIVGRILFLLYHANPLISVLPLNLLGMSVEFLIYAVVLFGFRFFDPISLARHTTIEQLKSGMLVLDPQGVIVSLNPAAAAILGQPSRCLAGRSILELLPAYAGEVGPLLSAGAGQVEINLQSGPEPRTYQVELSSLDDFRGQVVGRLLLLRDETAQKQARALILEQQRALATLQEREHLARELHDSLAQLLAAAHLQAGAARLLLAQGQTERAGECMDQVAEMTIAAETDVREYLLGAKIFFPATMPFLQALRQYVQRFSRQYGLQVELSFPEHLETEGLGQEIEVQALRIIQEALSNVRKHACASHAQVIISLVDSRVQIAIIDDGQGFDMVAAGQAEGFGLQSMRERAETLGGCLSVTSHAGMGTQVVMVAPLCHDCEVKAD